MAVRSARGQGLNIAYEAVDRHAAGARRDVVALRCIGRDGGDDRTDLPRLVGGDQPFRQSSARPGRWFLRPRFHPHGAGACAVHHGAGNVEEHERVRAVVRVRSGRSRCGTPRPRLGSRPGDHRGAVRAPRGGQPFPAARSATRPDHRRRAGSAGHGPARGCDGEGRHGLQHPAHGPGEHGPAALHQRDDGRTQRRDTRARGRGCPSRNSPVRTRPAPGRRVLVYGRSRLGHRHVVRDHRATDDRSHDGHGRWRVRRPALVPDVAGRNT